MTAKLTLIRDSYSRICFLGSKAGQPQKEWLDSQNIPFHKNANFYTAYPLEGGAVTVDKDRVEILGQFNTDAAAGEPRHSVLVALWYALNDADEAYSVPQFHYVNYRPDGSGAS